MSEAPKEAPKTIEIVGGATYNVEEVITEQGKGWRLEDQSQTPLPPPTVGGPLVMVNSAVEFRQETGIMGVDRWRAVWSVPEIVRDIPGVDLVSGHLKMPKFRESWNEHRKWAWVEELENKTAALLKLSTWGRPFLGSNDGTDSLWVAEPYEPIQAVLSVAGDAHFLNFEQDASREFTTAPIQSGADLQSRRWIRRADEWCKRATPLSADGISVVDGKIVSGGKPKPVVLRGNTLSFGHQLRSDHEKFPIMRWEKDRGGNIFRSWKHEPWTAPLGRAGTMSPWVWDPETGKLDLRSHSEEYWDSFAKTLELSVTERIVGIFSLIDRGALNLKKMWPQHSFNRKNAVGGVGDRAMGGFASEPISTSNDLWEDTWIPFLEQLRKEVQGYEGWVVFEIMNECRADQGPQAIKFHRKVVEILKGGQQWKNSSG